jgi:hypothetical protein
MFAPSLSHCGNQKWKLRTSRVGKYRHHLLTPSRFVFGNPRSDLIGRKSGSKKLRAENALPGESQCSGPTERIRTEKRACIWRSASVRAFNRDPVEWRSVRSFVGHVRGWALVGKSGGGGGGRFEVRLRITVSVTARRHAIKCGQWPGVGRGEMPMRYSADEWLGTCLHGGQETPLETLSDSWRAIDVGGVDCADDGDG